MLGKVTTPTLLIAGDGDIMSDVPSTELTFAGLGSPDKIDDEVRQVPRSCRRLWPLRPGLEPARLARDLSADHRLARPAPAGHRTQPAVRPVRSARLALSPVRKN